MAFSQRTPRAPAESNSIQPYRMHVSQRYLDLTKQKLELTRLPRDPQGSQHQQHDFGVSKADLEPLIDHWADGYDWRVQETFYNDTLPQYRAAVNGARLHFVHRRSQSPNAVPLLFVHGFPESFISVAPMIKALCDPIATPPHGDEHVQAFHVVAPSIPGFGFSDPMPEEGNAMSMTAATFDSLMRMLGYQQYIAHGCGWGFKICRMLALGCPQSCIAIHTVNPEVPPPRSGFGYTPEEMAFTGLSIQSPGSGLTPPHTPGAYPQPSERPQTVAYSLCDSPPGLLAYMLDAIRPPTLLSVRQGVTSASSSPLSTRSPTSPQPTSTPGRSPQAYQMLSQSFELPSLSTCWTPTAIINWTMVYWLPGPEVALRWLVNSAALVPSLWLSHSNVPLGITHFRDPILPSTGTGQTPPQWAEAYHRIVMITRREGRVRFPAWERPAEVVFDIRELAGYVLGGVA